MKLRLSTHGIQLSSELRQFIDRRIHFGMGRFTSRIQSLAIRLKDVNGPRGGVDQYCELRVDLGLQQPVIVRERRENIFSAIALAVGRAERAVVRRLSSQRNLRRPAIC